VDNSTEVLGVLELLTAANIKGNGLYVHIFFESVITCLVYFFGECCATITHSRGIGDGRFVAHH
jgi:hypothetical protein